MNRLVLCYKLVDGWVAHGFSRGEHESADHSCPPPLKRWATHPSMIPRIARSGALAKLAQVQPVDAGGIAQDAAQQSARLYGALLYGTVLLVVIVFGFWALSRMIRRHRERLRQKPTEPTTVEDVWSMHRLPDEDNLVESDQEPEDEP